MSEAKAGGGGAIGFIRLPPKLYLTTSSKFDTIPYVTTKGCTKHKHIMGNTQVVSSYVRGVRSHKQEANHDHTMSILIGGASVIMLAIVFAQVTIVVGLSVGAVYGLKTVLATNPRQTVVEAVTQAPEASEKPKRHYQKRIKVNVFDGKSVRV